MRGCEESGMVGKSHYESERSRAPESAHCRTLRRNLRPCAISLRGSAFSNVTTPGVVQSQETRNLTAESRQQTHRFRSSLRVKESRRFSSAERIVAFRFEAFLAETRRASNDTSYGASRPLKDVIIHKAMPSQEHRLRLPDDYRPPEIARVLPATLPTFQGRFAAGPAHRRRRLPDGPCFPPEQPERTQWLFPALGHAGADRRRGERQGRCCCREMTSCCSRGQRRRRRHPAETRLYSPRAVHPRSRRRAALPRVLHRQHPKPAHPESLRQGGQGICGLVRARQRRSPGRRAARPRGRLRRGAAAPTFGVVVEATPRRHQDAVRLARGRPGHPDEPGQRRVRPPSTPSRKARRPY